MPGIAFPRSCEFYRGSLGPRFPTPPGGSCPPPRGTVRCYDCLRPSRSVRFRSLPVPWVDALFVCVPPSSRWGRFVRGPRRPARARMLFGPVILYPAIAPKETGGSPEFPDYPCEHMPRSQTPVVSCPLALARTGLLPSNRCRLLAFAPVARAYPLTTTIHFSEFNDAACALAFPLLRTPPFRRSHFGSAIDLVASLGSSGTLHPLGNYDDFQGCHPIPSSRVFSRHEHRRYG